MSQSPRVAPRKQARQDRSRATVEAILTATARILVRDGHEKTTTNRVALEAGVSVGSLYQYFPSKEALVAALIERHCDEMITVLEANALQYASAPLPVAVRAAVESEVRAHAVDPALHRVLVEQIPRLGYGERLARVDRRAQEIVRAYFEAHRDEIRPRDLDLAAFMVVTMVEGFIHAAVMEHPARLSQQNVVDEMTEVVVRYLAHDPSEAAKLAAQPLSPLSPPATQPRA